MEKLTTLADQTRIDYRPLILRWKMETETNLLGFLLDKTEAHIKNAKCELDAGHDNASLNALRRAEDSLRQARELAGTNASYLDDLKRPEREIRSVRIRVGIFWRILDWLI
ncbi:hypothetical protein A2480_02485 [Candidatus Uhrbacteria bacterium RIFOXYC2_FULL_47_19]|uniref:Uncharacterized protein n=1 Tax=Candidatus Uhrbacteria bacterium RIFOXYC2_FULL_47_19 TaxID=1802424 RepID=A0A1F7WER1_9BACT|nr:MAG: hypothetical protein A2480_02485 [Candidatus Uhrbacteria bacterium RIFOXYC2_FULL_47_19]